MQIAPLVSQQCVHEIPKNVIDRDVAFLNAVDAVGFDDQTMIETEPRHFSTGVPGQTNGAHSDLLRLAKGVHEVGRIAAGRDADQAVTGPPLGDDLAYENMVKANIVADGRHHRAVASEVDGGQRRPAGRDRVQKLNRNVGSIAARAAIAYIELAPAPAAVIGYPLV